MDNAIRRAQRSGDPVQFLLAKMRAGQMSESMKRLLCALGYEPMVSALNLPAKTSAAQKSFMAPHTFCNYRDGRWLLGIDSVRVAKYICKKHWSQTLCQQVIKDLTPKLTDIPVRLAFEGLVDEIAQAGMISGAVSVRQEDGHYHIIDGHARLTAMRVAQTAITFYSIITQELRKEKVRNALIKALLQRLA